MFKSSRTSMGTNALRSLNQPERVQVRTSCDEPFSVFTRGVFRKIKVIEDVWRISDEWWRNRPIERTYYQTVLAGDYRLIIFRDDVTGDWYRQNYD